MFLMGAHGYIWLQHGFVESQTRTEIPRAGRGRAAGSNVAEHEGAVQAGRRRVGSPRRRPTLLPLMDIKDHYPECLFRKHEQTKFTDMPCIEKVYGEKKAAGPLPSSQE